MATTGETPPGFVEDNNYDNFNNIKVDDSSYARTNPEIGPTSKKSIYISQFGFAIPAGATINGIIHRVDHRGESTNICRETLQLTKTAGVGQGTDKWNRQNLTTSFVSQYDGTGTDLWGSSWTVSEINASGFGSFMEHYNSHASGTRYCDIEFASIDVYYTPAAATMIAKLVDSLRLNSLVHGRLTSIMRWLGLYPKQQVQRRTGKCFI